MDNEKAPYRDQIMAAVALMDRGCGRPAVGVFHASASGSTLSGAPDIEGEEGAGSALLMAARGSKDERILAQLLAEAERVKAATARDKQAHEMHLANAADALARGEEVDGLTTLLLRAKAANAERAAAPAPKRIEAKAEDVDAHPGANMPGFSEHLALKAKEKAEQERIEALRKMYPNQVPADVAFGIPDPQPGPEIVTFGRIPGLKDIRRVS